ncbi:MAG TPA: polyphosphate kinase 2 family protein [Acidimicrobiia bacterium]|jgi:PPK2 family polyphosphate:nucleotide phosphotransferase
MDRYRIPAGTEVDLSAWDPNDTAGFAGEKDEARGRLEELRDDLTSLQAMMWAESKHKLLVVLQAMDTGGKDGTIRNVFSGVNPQGVRVANFKAPTSHELARDYLWRIHSQVPATGEITVFNRSHYEDVLVVRVLGLADEARWRKRFSHINAFEQLLTDEGTTIVKFYLHISADEQKERLQARLDDREKHWKFNVDDLEHRTLWSSYMTAFEDVLSLTSTDNAPWYVVPANRKWYRNLVVAEVIASTLRRLAMRYPESPEDLSGVVIPEV